MMRDMDIIRTLLLELEANFDSNIFSTKSLPAVEGYSSEVVLAHFNLLLGAGFVERYRDAYGVGPLKDKHSLTQSGYDFLDSIRDDEIWRATKDSAKSVGGFTLDILGDIAKGLIRTKIKQHAGVEI